MQQENGDDDQRDLPSWGSDLLRGESARREVHVAGASRLTPAHASV
jgi:hypothetical protein